ncbi:RNA polymerase sigma factor [Nocardia carnea]|uniref:RNA polymerase sigma factor n=1 Tax=Nocardia carnea TaxID=37328 RepID=UPI00245775B0|nr:sigma-70 family RNA polymerase sigma factor [Nocardia carnea]
MTADVDDSEADFRGFVQEHWARVCGYVAALGAPPDVVDEAVQDAFIVMSREWQRLRDEAPKAYLFAVAHNRAVKLIRRHRAHAAATQSLEAMQVDLIDPRSDPVQVVTRETLADLLRRLPSRQRQAVELRYVHGFSIAETAEIMGTSTGTVKRSTYDGMQALQQHTEEGEGAR